MPLSRRTFVKGATAIPFAIWLEETGWAQTPNIRFDCTSAGGKAMLEIYAAAVKKMKDTTAIKEGDPHSWTFQWYTHAVRRDRSKASEIARIYAATPPPNTAWKALANEMWNTCQSHFAGMNPLNFLPWHRMVLVYFEQIIRSASGNNSFTLPYWNYTVSGALHGVIPPQFRMKGDAKFGSLYMEKRFPNGNAGKSISTGFTPDPINLDAFKQCKYEPTPPAILGFCQHIDRNLHGQVHVKTGNEENMSDVPWAAGDPVFWVHHCQIDRLWASWNARGGKNFDDPTWKSQSFVFADGTGKRVTAKIGDVLSLTQVKYSYDNLETSTPPCTLGKPSPNASVARRLVTKAAPIALLPKPVTQVLTAPPSPNATLPLGERIKKLAPGKRLFVVVNGLQSTIQPGIAYDLYLDLPAAAGGQRSAYFVGSIHFFDSVAHQGHMPDLNRPFSFDVTDLAKKLAAEGTLKATAELTFAPAGTPAAGAVPLVGEVSIIEQ
jgi:tyrosinase